MNPYFLRILIWLGAAGLATFFSSEPPMFFYGATFAVIGFALLDNFVPPKPFEKTEVVPADHDKAMKIAKKVMADNPETMKFLGGGGKK